MMIMIIIMNDNDLWLWWWWWWRWVVMIDEGDDSWWRRRWSWWLWWSRLMIMAMMITSDDDLWWFMNSSWQENPITRHGKTIHENNSKPVCLVKYHSSLQQINKGCLFLTSIKVKSSNETNSQLKWCIPKSTNKNIANILTPIPGGKTLPGSQFVWKSF